MKYYLVQGKETEESADDAFTFHYSSSKGFTFKELETLALEEYCSDEGIEKAKDGKYYWCPEEMTDEVLINIWDIFQSDSPITLLTQTNKEQN